MIQDVVVETIWTMPGFRSAVVVWGASGLEECAGRFNNVSHREDNLTRVCDPGHDHSAVKRMKTLQR